VLLVISPWTAPQRKLAADEHHCVFELRPPLAAAIDN
jgi:hypothetical protein